MQEVEGGAGVSDVGFQLELSISHKVGSVGSSADRGRILEQMLDGE